ncbi:hypothetical protein KPL47_05510 [Clostridium estertheticum]|nr:hypothetical protein [Clostridium estertheticum]
MTKVMKTMDGNEACAYVSYAFTEVATIQSQFLKAVVEAENYPGSSLIIAYVPCISHGLKGANREFSRVFTW